MSAIIGNRYDIVYLFDCKDGNPNGDPDAANAPRIDPETRHGLVSDVCLKRKIRNFVLSEGGTGNDIFIQQKSPLNPRIAEMCAQAELPSHRKADGNWDKENAKKRPPAEIKTLQEALCARYFDIRAFGGVLSTGPNAGQIRGPVQFTFSRSVDPVLPLDLGITRVADVDKPEGEMGRKNLIPYGLFRCQGFISANLAKAPCNFSKNDLALLFRSLCGRASVAEDFGRNMFMGDESSSHGLMAPRMLVVFKHESPLGNAPAHKLFDRITVRMKESVKAEKQAPRSFNDYDVLIDREQLPKTVELLELLL
ncbi:MAG: type I-C CRISPR-associated protein Cas7/Csd2 [Terracidiphilus sp.]|jgi:CRISPR-associated protein Csd2